MSHELEQRADGTGVAVFTREPAWHGLGVVLPDEVLTIEQALDAVPEMAADVDLVPLVARLADGTEIETDAYATIRRGFSRPLPGVDIATGEPQIEEVLPKVLGAGLSDRYVVLQNRAAMSFVDDLVDESGAKIVTAGLLRGGSQAWVLCRMPKTVEVGGISGEEVETYLLVTNSFDGSLAVGVHVTRVRVVCANTLGLALGGTPRSYKVRHTTKLDDRLAEARAALSMTFRYEDAFENAANALLANRVTDAEFDAFLESLVPSEGKSERGRIDALNVQSIIRDVYESTDDLSSVRGTAWGALQAVSDYADHRRYATPEGRFRAAMLGEKSLTQSAYDLLVAA